MQKLLVSLNDVTGYTNNGANLVATGGAVIVSPDIWHY